MRFNFSDIQRNVSELANRQEYTKDILYELMAAYGRSASSITKLRNGIINQAEDEENTILQRGVVYFKHTPNVESLPAQIEKLEQDPLTARYNPRFLIATDYVSFAAKDTKKGNTLETKWEDIDRNVDFFYGWTGDEVTDEKTEAAADRRAADKMKELYYEVEKVNAGNKSISAHDLNVFFARLLFCFFAEDTHVFTREDKNIFTNAIKDFTQTDGGDLDTFLETLFEALDTKDEEKDKYTSPFSNFPYVNGSLFDAKRGISIPKFNAQARKLILDCGALSWAEINPDIFGSMFQSIVDEAQRSTHGMHYTSVPNIMKTIEPLFLDELREEFDKNYENPRKLAKLHNRIANIKVFDPACGSGNFLIIAYKELRKLEHAILERLLEDKLPTKITSRIDLNNFYGIEIDDFACEVAVLSLYLAKHQMNIEFEKQFDKEIKLIPLKVKANIVHGNAARLDWQEVCPNEPVKSSQHHKQEQLIVDERKQEELIEDEDTNVWEEIYLISNPPYLGSRNQDSSQKEDLKLNTPKYKSLDYIAIWFIKGSKYLADNPKAELAFVSTNSITQGEQVALLWPAILKGKEISFAHTSFKWTSNARNSAGVTCVIIGIRNAGEYQKYIIANEVRYAVENITPYLSKGKSAYIHRRSKPVSNIPPASFGSMPNDGGALILDEKEKNELVAQHPDAQKYIKKFSGAADMLRGLKRYCLDIKDKDLDMAKTFPVIKRRLELVKEHRLASSEASTRKLASHPNRFYFYAHKSGHSIMVPSTTSERRSYIPMAYLDDSTIISNAAQVIYNSEPWLFSILSSNMHMAWIRAVAGQLETRIRYSSAIVYNNFPVPELSEKQKDELNRNARDILFARESHTEKTLAEMYDPSNMPEDLKEAHEHSDLVVDGLYRQKPYENNEERLADLFELYEKMTTEEEK